MNKKIVWDLLILSILTIIITFLIWLPHFLAFKNFWGLNFSNGFNTIYRNFDGLEYVIIAKTFYKQQSLYFASHFPGYSILIALVSPFLGFLKSMLFVSVASTILSVWAFYLFVHNLKLSSHPLFLSFLFLVLPARWLIVHSVGSSEPLFIFLVITTLYFFIKFEQTGHATDIILASVAGFFTQIVRPPGILLFIALMLYVHWKFYLQSKVMRFYPMILVPIGLLSIFYLYNQTYGDFWAYFHSGDNIHLTFPPFQVFNKNQFWVGDIWLEDIVYIFILGFLGGITLWKRKLYSISFFVLTYLAASTLVIHRDVSRYILPISPFILIAFEKVLTSKEFKIVLPIILLALYLYAQNFILQNTAPIPNLELYN